MKRKLPVLIAIVLALVIALAACQAQNQPAATGTNTTDPLPSHVQQTDPTDTTLPADPVNGEPVPADPAPADPKLISMDEAIAIALQDAGFKEADVTGLHAELERDDGITYYDVDFYKGGKEYDYEIHAETGKILEPVKKDNAGASSGSASSTSSNTITKEEAIATALSHAGLEKSQVSHLRAELDRENGVTVYDVEFETAQWEYEYEVNAQTGGIIKAEKDYND